MKQTLVSVADFLRCHKKNISLVGSAAIALSFLGSGTSAQTQVPQTEPTVWAHKVSWTTINNLNHTQRRDFPLGMGPNTWPGQPSRVGDQTTVDDTTACALAQSAGIDAFALDIFPGQGLSNNTALLSERLNAAAALRAESGKPFYISPCLDSPTQLAPSQLATLIQGLVANLAQRPEWPKFNGSPIIWTYNATGVSSTYWQQVFSLLNAQNVKVDIILDAGSLFSQATTTLPKADLNAYANLPVGLYSFGGDTAPGVSACRQYLAANYPNSLAVQLTIGTVQPGYWSEATGLYGDPQATKVIRDGFAAASSSRWVTVTTWDDYGENTQIEPSLNMGTGRLDLIHSLVSARHGQSWPSKSQFYLWQPSEVHQADPTLGNITGEALALLPAGQTPTTVEVDLCDSNMNVITAGTPTTFNTGGVQAVPYSFPLTQMPASHCAYLKYTVASADVPQHSYLSEPIAVWPTDNPWRTMTGVMWQTGTQAKQANLTLINTGSVPQFTKAQYSSFAGQFFPLLNSNLLTFPTLGSSQFMENMAVSQSLGPDLWDLFAAVPAAQRWGFFGAKGINPDGTLGWSTPVWVQPTTGYSAITSLWHFDQGKGTAAADSTCYANPATLQGGATWTSPGQAGASCLTLDGKTGSVSIPQGIFPMGSFTFQAQIKPTLSAGATGYTKDQYIFCDVAASLLLRLDAGGHLIASRKDSNGWETAIGTTVVPANQWSQVTVTYDQQHLNVYLGSHLEAIVACTGTQINTLTTLGCNPSNGGSNYFQGSLDEVQVQALAVAPAGAGTTILTPDQQVNFWHFDEGTGTTANNATPYGIFLTLPSGTGWSKPGQTGAACLTLDGKTGSVNIPNGSFPHGSFTFQAQIKPTLSAGATGYTKDQYIFDDVGAALVLRLDAGGHLVAQRTDANGWETAIGTTVVPANQWSQVTVTYDQQHLNVYLGSHLEAIVACTGTHVNIGTALGCNPYNSGSNYFQGSLDEVGFQPTVVPPAGAGTTILTPDQQVNFWHFDEGTGTTANNATPYGIFLTLPSGTGWSKPGQTGAACLTLDGKTGSVNIPNGSFPHGSFTFQAEVKSTMGSGVKAYSQQQYIFCDVTGALIFYIGTDGRLVAQRTDANGWEYAFGTTPIPANQWAKVTVTYDQQNLRIYLGGHLEGTGTCTGTHINANTVMGYNPYNGGYGYFQGFMDEVEFQPQVVVPTGP